MKLTLKLNSKHGFHIVVEAAEKTNWFVSDSCIGTGAVPYQWSENTTGFVLNPHKILERGLEGKHIFPAENLGKADGGIYLTTDLVQMIYKNRPDTISFYDKEGNDEEGFAYQLSESK